MSTDKTQKIDLKKVSDDDIKELMEQGYAVSITKQDGFVVNVLIFLVIFFAIMETNSAFPLLALLFIQKTVATVTLSKMTSENNGNQNIAMEKENAS